MTILQQFNITSIAIVELDTSGGPSTYSLPQITPFEQGILIKDATGNAGANNVTISHPTLNIDGAGTYLLAANYQSALFVSDGQRVIAQRFGGLSSGPVPFTPIDASGFGPLFSGVSVDWCRDGPLVKNYGQVNYGFSVDAHQAAITLPVPVVNANYGAVVGLGFTTNGLTPLVLQAQPNTSKAIVYKAGAIATNADLSNGILYFMLIYPAS